MQIVKCMIHDVEFRLPTDVEEFTLGKLHQEVESCQLHLEEFPDCKLVETTSV